MLQNQHYSRYGQLVKESVHLNRIVSVIGSTDSQAPGELDDYCSGL